MRETKIGDRSRRGSEMRFLGNVAGYKKKKTRQKSKNEMGAELNIFTINKLGSYTYM